MDNFPIWIKVLIIVGVVIAATLLGQAVMLGFAYLGGMRISDASQIFDALSDDTLRPYIKTGIGLSHFVSFTVSAMVLSFIFFKSGWRSYFSFKSFDISLGLLFLGLLVFAYPIIGGSAYLSSLVDFPSWMDSMDEINLDALSSVLEMNGLGDLVVNLIIVAVLPAIGEELLFRGVVQRELLNAFSNPHVAILITAIIFSAFHLQAAGFLPKLFIGLILGYAYYWTKSLWYPILLHFLNNGLQTFALYLSGGAIDTDASMDMDVNITFLSIAMFLSAIACYFIVIKIREAVGNFNRIVV